MAKTIWKYKLPRDGQTIHIEEYIVEVLHIAAQDGIPTLWAVVDPDVPREGYTEVVAWGTGWPLPDDVYQECDYWGTCGDYAGHVWHYFAATRYPERINWTTTDLWVDYSNAIADKLYTLDNTVTNLEFVSPSITLSSHSGDADAVTIDMETLKKWVSTTCVDGCNTATSSVCQ